MDAAPIAPLRGVPQPHTVLVAAGEFIMGDSDGRNDERPAHRVYMSAFSIAMHPVTNAEFAAFVEATGHEPPRFWTDHRFNAADQPVVGVSWFDAVAYCDWLSAHTGGRFRLPTEAEREKAACGGVEGARFPWGDDPGEAGGSFVQDAPHPVGRSTPNGYGLFDMACNIHEWCSDWYDRGYYAVSPDPDPCGPETGTRRSSRGGAWRHQIKISRSAARSSLSPSFRYNDYGFRVVREITDALDLAEGR